MNGSHRFIQAGIVLATAWVPTFAARADEPRVLNASLGGQSFYRLLTTKRVLPDDEVETEERESLRIRQPSMSLETTRRYVESKDGLLLRAEFEDSSGEVWIVRFEVESGDRVRAVVSRAEGRLAGETIDSTILPFLPDGPLSRRLRIRSAIATGCLSVSFYTLEWSGTEPIVRERQFRLVGEDADGMTTWVDPADESARSIFNRQGELVGGSYRFLGRRIEVEKGAVGELVSRLSLERVSSVPALGPAPEPGEVQCFSVPEELLRLARSGPFQTRTGDVVEVRPESIRQPLECPEPYLTDDVQLEIDRAELCRWVSGRIPPESGTAATITALRDATTNWLTDERRIADATALEVLRARSGGCAEAATLLCAALRAAKVPARIEFGLLYRSTLNRWIPHAWVAAYSRDDGRWIHADATRPSDDRSLLIAFSEGRESTPAARRARRAAFLEAIESAWLRRLPALPGASRQ